MGSPGRHVTGAGVEAEAVHLQVGGFDAAGTGVGVEQVAAHGAQHCVARARVDAQRAAHAAHSDVTRARIEEPVAGDVVCLGVALDAIQVSDVPERSETKAMASPSGA